MTLAIAARGPDARRLLLAALLFLPARAPSEQLPLKSYTTADGLASGRVRCILADSRGFLWLGTGDGLSLFDGYGFTNYSVEDGLPSASVQALLESRDGAYWIATTRGLVRWEASRVNATLAPVALGPEGSVADVQALVQDRSGAVWAGTARGLFSLHRTAGAWNALPVRLGRDPGEGGDSVVSLLEDRSGFLWAGTENGLYRKAPNGAAERVELPGVAMPHVRTLVEDRHGSVWAGTFFDGLFELSSPRAGARASVLRQLTRGDGLAGHNVTALLETSDGRLWAASYGGVTEISPDRRSVRAYTQAEGLSGLGIWSLAEDRDGNVWIGGDDSGLMRLARDGFRRYGARDGMKSDRVTALFEGPGSLPCAFTRGKTPEEIAGSDGYLECWDGTRFHTGRPRLPAGTKFGWGWQQMMRRDRAGEWWVPTFSGLFRFPAIPLDRLESVPPRRVYTTADGLPSNSVFRLYEDSRGDLWISLLTGESGRLARWDRRSDSIRVYGEADGVPDALPMAFAEDAAGAVWIGFKGGALARHREGRTDVFGEKDGLPGGSVRALLVDAAGRLWIASSRGGVARLDAPADATPRFLTFGKVRGLTGSAASSLAEDRFGRIYAGTEHGLERIDPASDNIQRFTADDGLAPGEIMTTFRDAGGGLWFGSSEGLSRLEPVREKRRASTDVRITRVTLDGVAQPLPPLGDSLVSLPDAAREAAPLEIDFGGIDFAPGGRLRYQYRLVGVDRGWSAPSEKRSVVLARLPGDAYRFQARAIANDGSVGTMAAEVRFTVLPPLWRRPEFVLLALLAATVLGYVLHRNRLRSALAVERVRIRVATDLHDDIGADLSEIAILSELAGKRGESERAPLLIEIGNSARRLVDTMGDIVWSTDPRRDDLGSVVQRIRHFAANALEARGVFWTVESPERFESLSLGPERRREIYLIVKEAVTNIARHSECSRAVLRFRVSANTLSITIEDDGKGFDDPSEASPSVKGSSGNGLASMRARADALGAEFRVESHPGGGTRILLGVPLVAASRRAAW